MLDDKQIRMLELLDNKISRCYECNLHRGGRVTPFWTSLSKYVIIGEAPGKEEVENNEPFTGKTGRILWKLMEKHNFRKEEFLIVNTVQCRPTDGNKNLKPAVEEIVQCKKIWEKYIKVINPYKILVLGNYASGSIGNGYNGIIQKNANSHLSYEFDRWYVTSIHPSYCIYNKTAGYKMLEDSIKKFKITY